MAFMNKVGSLLKQSVVKHINRESSAFSPSIYQAIRSMSSAKVFVGGISYSTDDTSLKEAFSRYGEVIDARVIMDRETNRSRGFGFITFATSEDASAAIQGMDGQDLHGRRIRVNYATERSRPGFGGGGGYAGSNYGGNDYRNNYGGSDYRSNYGGSDYRTGGYEGSGYGVRDRPDSYGGGNAGPGTGYTDGSNVNSGVYDGSSGGNYGVPDGAGASNFQFHENSVGDLGSVSSELSSNSGLGYGDGQFGSHQNDRAGQDDGGSFEPFEDNQKENTDEAGDYAQSRR